MPDSILDKLRAVARKINLKQNQIADNPAHPELSTEVEKAKYYADRAAKSPIAQVVSGPSKVYWAAGNKVGKAALTPVVDYAVQKTGLQDAVTQQKADWAKEDARAKELNPDPVDGGEIEDPMTQEEMAKRQNEWRLRQAIRSRMGQ